MTGRLREVIEVGSSRARGWTAMQLRWIPVSACSCHSIFIYLVVVCSTRSTFREASASERKGRDGNRGPLEQCVADPLLRDENAVETRTGIYRWVFLTTSFPGMARTKRSKFT